jgi:murein DD-endopeptidase MepM/ murein hydrolase activator NlpD
MSRRFGVVALLGAVVLSAASAAPAAMPAGRPVGPAASAYVAPVAGVRVVRPFEAPTTPFGPGHRGVDLATRPGEAVHAAGTGVVSFAGSVAGRGVVVVKHPDGVSTEYEPVAPVVARGRRVHIGAVIGHLQGRHGSCTPGGCLHWGARRSGEYFDPLLLLRPLGPVRLLPWRPD